MLFSATLDRRVGQLVTRYLNEPALHAVSPQAETASIAEHSVLVLSAQDKFRWPRRSPASRRGPCSSSGPSTARTGSPGS